MNRMTKGIAALTVGAVGVVQPITAEAMAINLFMDVPGYFTYMTESRDRILSYKETVKNLKDAKEALQEARDALKQARTDRTQAIANLKEAAKDLAAAQQSLKEVNTELIQARKTSADCTQAALASQQAVVDFQPQVWAQQSVVDETSAQLEAANQQAAAAERTVTVTTDGGSSDQAARVAAAWASVGYAANRLEEVQAMVGEDTGGATETQVVEDNHWEQEAAAIDTKLEEAENTLSDLTGQLEELRDAQTDAEAEEAEARQQVKELEQEQAKGIAEQKEAETGLQAAQVEDQETAKELISSEKDQEAAAKEEAEAARALKHFGQGQSQSIGAEYYSWNGKNGHGHQLYIPYSYTINMPKVDISLSTGYVISRNARSSSDNVTSNGVTGMTDTTLETVFRNDHKVNDLHYLLSVNLPTGNSIAGGNASLPDNLARFTSFGAGTDLTPGLEAIHHFNDWDSAAVRLTYSHRGGYDNSQSLFGDENNNERVTDTERVHIEPGSLWTQELEYLHAGVKEQFLGLVQHQNGSRTQQTGGSTGYVSRDEGDYWDLGLFYSKDFTPKDSWQTYTIHSYEGSDTVSGAVNQSGLNRGIHYHVYGLGWTHQVVPKEKLRIMWQYLYGTGALDNWRSGMGTDSPHRLSCLIGYDWQLGQTDTLSLQAERYTLHDNSAGDYHGWNTSILFNKSI